MTIMMDLLASSKYHAGMVLHGWITAWTAPIGEGNVKFTGQSSATHSPEPSLSKDRRRLLVGVLRCSIKVDDTTYRLRTSL